MAILVHPDRNHHEKASDAFKSANFSIFSLILLELVQARDILINSESRNRYNRFGTVSNKMPFAQPMYKEESLEEMMDIFSVLFASQSANYSSRTRRRNQFHSTEQDFHFFPRNHRYQMRPKAESFNFKLLFYLFSLLAVLIFITLITQFSSIKSDYSLFKSPYYSLNLKTETGLEYWINPEFQKFLLNNVYVQNLEKRVSESWLNRKKKECYQDRMRTKESHPQSCSEYEHLSTILTK